MFQIKITRENKRVSKTKRHNYVEGDKLNVTITRYTIPIK